MTNMYSIGQFAKKTGLTIRALRYYDEKGLLTPAHISQGGQRLYNDDNILTVQKIVTYKYLDFICADRGIGRLAFSLTIHKGRRGMGHETNGAFTSIGGNIR